MKEEHKTEREALIELQKTGIPMTVLEDRKWFAVIPTACSSPTTFELPYNIRGRKRFTVEISAQKETVDTPVV